MFLFFNSFLPYGADFLSDFVEFHARIPGRANVTVHKSTIMQAWLGYGGLVCSVG